MDRETIPDFTGWEADYEACEPLREAWCVQTHDAANGICKRRRQYPFCLSTTLISGFPAAKRLMFSRAVPTIRALS